MVLHRWVGVYYFTDTIEVKGDNKIDDIVVKAKQSAAQEIASESKMEYIMYAGSSIMNSNILENELTNKLNNLSL